MSLSVQAKQSGSARLFFARQRQRGDMVLNIVIGLALMLIIAVLAAPRINGLLIEGRTPEVASELQRFMSRMQIMSESGQTLPFATVSNEKNLALALDGSSAVRVTGNVVAHRLGGRGIGSDGVVTLSPANLNSAGLGSAYTLRLTNVNQAACPTLVSILQNFSEAMVINSVEVKGSSAGTYNPVDAQGECVKGDTNEFIFTAR